MSTWGPLKQEILDEYDLNEETFINEAELLALANRALRSAEAQIHEINEKYFETDEPLALETDVSEYPLPEGIYATKITGIFYNNGAEKYEIKPLKDKRRILDVESNDVYRYRIVNSSGAGLRIKFYPASRETSPENVTVFYIRNVKKITSEADEIDIPEAENFLKQYVIEKAANKERMTPDAPDSAALMSERKLLIDSLTTRTPDDNNEVTPDFSHYDQMV
ncbi:hypothetical protein D3C87_124940 [compost metagenome]